MSITGWRLPVAILILVGLVLSTMYFVFPEYILQAMVASARHSAGLQRRSVDVAGQRIVYLDGGSGEPVVLLHGFGANKDLWDAVAGHLTPRYRVIAPDLPGFGESPALEAGKYDAQSQARRLRAFLDALGVRDHHIGGSSMGGFIAVAYAAMYPANVRSLLIGAAPGVRSPQKSELDRRLEAGENPLLVRNEADLDQLLQLAFFRPPSVPGPFKRAMLHDAIERHATYAKIFEDLKMAQPGEGALGPLLPSLSTRTLIVWGAHDRLVDPSAANVFSAAIPNAQKAILEDCGHALPRECPDLLARRYRTFLDSASAEDAPKKRAAGQPAPQAASTTISRARFNA
jgi:pimeloyl-ACP methyl ester carboxylesterase